MRIGFDFDNTIVSYDSLFHKVALEQGVIPTEIPVNKIAVRDYLRSIDKENIWTEMQGYVYGARMNEATAYPKALEVILKLKQAGHSLAIISHKTKYPYLGEKYDLHQAAQGWINLFLKENEEPLLSDEQIFFELTKVEKINRINQCACDIYIDDLPEILLADNFPANATRILFDPEKNYQQQDFPSLKIISTWEQFENHLT